METVIFYAFFYVHMDLKCCAEAKERLQINA